MVWALRPRGAARRGRLPASLFGPFWVVLGVVPPIVLNLVVRGKARKVRKDFGEQLPENLDVLASALRAGHSLAGAMGVVADEAPRAVEARVPPCRDGRVSSGSLSTRRSR